MQDIEGVLVDEISLERSEGLYRALLEWLSSCRSIHVSSAQEENRM